MGCMIVMPSAFAAESPVDEDVNKVIASLMDEVQGIQLKFHLKRKPLSIKRIRLEQALSYNLAAIEKIDVLWQLNYIKKNLHQLFVDEQSEISKVRYLKGLQIIKILYEKSLTLDHHFASVSTFHEINKLSNPNQYPEFVKMKEELVQNQDKKSGFQLKGILGNNLYTSVVHSLVSLFHQPGSDKREKQVLLDEVECILDFTLRMHQDLNTIYFETAFLQKSNDNILIELQQLFTDYTKPIDYPWPLKECRKTDDWENVRDHLGQYLERMDRALRDPDQQYKAHKMQIDLEFPIDRLLQFISLYNAHIDQSAKFYEKFSIMLNSYENEEQCATKIPMEYAKIKENVSISIEKFNNAYRPVEINGSKMKQILYGINEYD